MTTDSAHIRAVIPTDLSALLAIEDTAFAVDAFSADDFARYVQYDGVYFQVIVVEQAIIGYILGYIQGNTGRVASIAVDKQWRRQGYGKMLFDRILKHITDIQATHIEIEVRADNQGAQLFWSSNGFIEKRVIEKYYRDGVAAILMSRHIQPQCLTAAR